MVGKSQLYGAGSASISFSADFGKDLRLIEVPNDILGFLESGESLRLIGDDANEVVLCTGKNTYSVKRVESSNSVYFVPPAVSSGGFVIQSMCSDYYELKLTPAKFDKLDRILVQTQYSGLDEADSDGTDMLTRDSLADMQASQVEIDEYLRSIDVVEMRGKLRLLSRDLLLSATKLLLDTIMEERWACDSISATQCATQLREVHPVVLRHVLSGVGSEVEDGLWRLEQDKLLVASAHVVFSTHRAAAGVDHQQVGPGYHSVRSCLQCSPVLLQVAVAADEFLREWGNQTPGLAPSADLRGLAERLLRGVALQVHGAGATKERATTSSSSSGAGAVVAYRYFPLRDLSRVAKVRFAQLFEERPKFRLEELEPYLQDLFCASGDAQKPRSQAELLLLYTKCIDQFYFPK